MENITTFNYDNGLEEALLHAVKKPKLSIVSEVIPPTAVIATATNKDTKDYTLVYIILTTLAISLAYVAYKDYTSRKKKDQEQQV